MRVTVTGYGTSDVSLKVSVSDSHNHPRASQVLWARPQAQGEGMKGRQICLLRLWDLQTHLDSQPSGSLPRRHRGELRPPPPYPRVRGTRTLKSPPFNWV